MLSAIVHAEIDEPAIFETLTALVPALADGLLRDVVLAVPVAGPFAARAADAAGCEIVAVPGPRHPRLTTAAAALRAPWLLVLEAGTVPAGAWIAEIDAFIAAAGDEPLAASFTIMPRAGRGRLSALVANARTSLTGRAPALAGLLLPRDVLVQGRSPPAARRLSSPIIDRRKAS